MPGGEGQGHLDTQKGSTLMRVPIQSLGITFFKIVGHSPRRSSYRLPHSFSLGICSQAVISKTIATLLMHIRDEKGNHCFLRGRLRKQVTTCRGRMSSEKWRNEKWKVFSRAVTNATPLIELDGRVGRDNLTDF